MSTRSEQPPPLPSSNGTAPSGSVIVVRPVTQLEWDYCGFGTMVLGLGAGAALGPALVTGLLLLLNSVLHADHAADWLAWPLACLPGVVIAIVAAANAPKTAGSVLGLLAFGFVRFGGRYLLANQGSLHPQWAFQIPAFDPEWAAGSGAVIWSLGLAACGVCAVKSVRRRHESVSTRS